MSTKLDMQIKHGIPLVECYSDHHGDKKLLFFVHGYHGKKEDTYEMIIDLARLGFFVVSIDAFEHGERTTEAFLRMTDQEKDEIFMKLIIETARDIELLWEREYIESYRSASVMGISMGGMVAYLCGVQMESMKAVVSIIATPSFYEFAEHSMEKSGIDKEAHKEELLQIRNFDPSYNFRRLENKKILSIVSNQDEVVPSFLAKDFHQMLLEYQLDSFTQLIEYDGGHTVTEQMKKDIYAWCTVNLL